MEYYRMTAYELGIDAKITLVKMGESQEVFEQLALEMVEAIEANNKENKKTVFICPVGPVGQYPIFVRLVKERKLSLKTCWFINMDEYLDEAGNWLPKTHRLSFRGFMDRQVYSQIPEELLMPEAQRVFPDPQDIAAIPALIEQLGGVDIAFGGIGINGHLAFNEPQPELSVAEFAKLNPRVLTMTPQTHTVNAIGDLGGALEDMPTQCVTIGMAQILGARKVRLGVFRDWHRAVVRRAAYGEVTSAFPVTLLQQHPDAKIYVNQVAAQAAY